MEDITKQDKMIMSRRGFLAAGVSVASFLALGGSIFALVGLDDAKAATHFQGRWNPDAITNDGWIYLAPHIQVDVDYAPGDKYMEITFSRVSVGTNVASKDGDGFWDGYVLTIPPAPTSDVHRNYSGSDSSSAGKNDLTNWATSGVVWGAVQSNKNSTAAGNTVEFGPLGNGSTYTYKLDVSGYAPGSYPVIALLGGRYRTDGANGTNNANVGLYAQLSTQTLGIPIRIKPKITATTETGGSIDPPGVTYVDYEGDQDYTITPSKYWKIKDVKVDGSSVGARSTYPFRNVTYDRTIVASFEAITGTLKIQKRDSDLKTNYGQGNATLNRTKFEVKCVDSPHYTNGAVIATLYTDASGAASCVLKGGKFEVYEAIESADYHLSDTSKKAFEIDTDDKVVDLTSQANSFFNNVERGGVEIRKVDADAQAAHHIQDSEATLQGDGVLSGAIFKIYNVSEHNVYVNGVEYPTYKDKKDNGFHNLWGALTIGQYAIDCHSASYRACATLTTDANGKATTGLILPVGTYVICESTPPKGYLINADLEKGITFNITGQGDMVYFTNI